jgi:hypothetical protein
VLFQLDNPKKLSQVTLSFLEDVKNGVLAPASVEVWGGENKNNLRKLGRVVNTLPQHERPASKGIIRIIFPAQSVRFVRLKATNARTLPKGLTLPKNVKASIFIDEVSLE